MHLVSKHKAAIITALITGIIILLMFNLHLSNRLVLVAESYYEIEPEEIIKEEKIEPKLVTNGKKQTNLAFNENEEFKDLDDNYMDKIKAHYDKYSQDTQTKEVTENKVEDLQNTNSDDESSNDEAYQSYNRINSLIASKAKKQKSSASNGDNSSKKISIGTGSNSNSTMSYSLVGRTHEFLPTPVYLCESGGIIIINITVNQKGRVIQTSVNGSSTSTNECLIDHATEYAKNAIFSQEPSRKSQIGTISFQFIGKN